MVQQSLNQPCLHPGGFAKIAEGSLEVIERFFAPSQHAKPSDFCEVHRTLCGCPNRGFSERWLASFKLVQHANVVLSQRVNAEHGGSFTVKVLLCGEQAGNPSQSNGFHIIVVEQCQPWDGLLIVSLSQAGSAEHQSSGLSVPSTLKSEKVNGHLFGFVPSAQTHMEQHFGLG